jgi:hypothetical protein
MSSSNVLYSCPCKTKTKGKEMADLLDVEEKEVGWRFFFAIS